jgi:hypothetical protein
VPATVTFYAEVQQQSFLINSGLNFAYFFAEP